MLYEVITLSGGGEAPGEGRKPVPVCTVRVPDPVCHVIATHAGEGDLVRRSTEALIVHHADFMSYEPFKNL